MQLFKILMPDNYQLNTNPIRMMPKRKQKSWDNNKKTIANSVLSMQLTRYKH